MITEERLCPYAPRYGVKMSCGCVLGPYESLREAEKKRNRMNWFDGSNARVVELPRGLAGKEQ